MICSSLYLLFLMSAILLMSGLHFLYLGTAGGEQVTLHDDIIKCLSSKPQVLSAAQPHRTPCQRRRLKSRRLEPHRLRSTIYPSTCANS